MEHPNEFKVQSADIDLGPKMDINFSIAGLSYFKYDGLIDGGVGIGASQTTKTHFDL